MIDTLLAALNTITGVTFVRDAWNNAPAGDYGVVDTASETIMWADNKPALKQEAINVWLYTSDVGETKAEAVRAILTADQHMVSYRQVSRTLVTNPLMVQWHWEIILRGAA